MYYNQFNRISLRARMFNNDDDSNDENDGDNHHKNFTTYNLVIPSKTESPLSNWCPAVHPSLPKNLGAQNNPN